jgi:hypothetical protein
MTAFRKSLRHIRRLEIDFGGFIPAITADVSTTGFCADMLPVFLPGSRVEGTIAVDDVKHAFRGEIAWARAGDPMASLLSRVGVRFEWVAPGFLAAFEPSPKRRKKRTRSP